MHSTVTHTLMLTIIPRITRDYMIHPTIDSCTVTREVESVVFMVYRKDVAD